MCGHFSLVCLSVFLASAPWVGSPRAALVLSTSEHRDHLPDSAGSANIYRGYLPFFKMYFLLNLLFPRGHENGNTLA